MITVIAGVNGSGKSSIVGNRIRDTGAEFYNPDEKARDIQKHNPNITLAEANGAAWQYGYDLLCESIEAGYDFVFETTLGANSISEKLHEAVERNQGLRMIFIGLASAELHIERVKARVERGGHDIPEEKIRQRWIRSIYNMRLLLPRCQDLKVYDNSKPLSDGKPNPVLLFSMRHGRFKSPPIQDMPNWAKPLAVAAIEMHNQHSM